MFTKFLLTLSTLTINLHVDASRDSILSFENVEAILKQDVNYTSINKQVQYLSRSDYDHGIWKNLDRFVSRSVDWILPNPIPEGVEELKDVILVFHVELSLFKNYPIFMSVIFILAIAGIAITSFGLIYFIRKCFKRNDRKSTPKFGRKRLKIVIFSGICLGLAIFFIVGMVYVTNKRIESGIKELSSNLNKSIIDSNTYLETTISEMETLIVVNFKELTDTVVKIGTAATLDTMNAVFKMINIKEINDIRAHIFKNLDSIKKKIKTADRFISEINDMGHEMQGDISTEVLQVLQTMLMPKFDKFNAKIPSPNIRLQKNGQNADGKDLLPGNIISSCSKMPACQQVLSLLDKLKINLNSSLFDGVTNGIDRALADKKFLEFGNLHVEIELYIRTEMKDQISIVDIQLQEVANMMMKIHRNVSDQFHFKANEATKIADRYLKTGQEYLDHYNQYRNLLSLIICSILFIIFICIAMGLLLGTFASNPKNMCCTKAMGGHFLTCEIIVIFFTSLFICLTAAAYLTAGAFSKKVICDTLQNSNDSKVNRMLDNLVLTDYGLNTKISDILTNVHLNKSLYQTVRPTILTNLYNLDSLLDKINFTNPLDNKIDFHFPNKDKFFKQSQFNLDINQLDQIEKINILEQFDKFFNDLDVLMNVTVVLKPMFGKVNEYFNKIQIKQVEPLAGHVQNFQEQVKKLRWLTATFNKQLPTDVQLMIRQTEKIMSETTRNVKLMTVDLVKKLMDMLHSYLVDRVLNNIRLDIGRTGPLSLIINNTYIAVCDEISLPMNVYWFILSWTILAFIPTLILSILLINNFKTSPMKQNIPKRNCSIIRSNKELYDKVITGNVHLDNMEGSVEFSVHLRHKVQSEYPTKNIWSRL